VSDERPVAKMPVVSDMPGIMREVFKEPDVQRFENVNVCAIGVVWGQVLCFAMEDLAK